MNTQRLKDDKTGAIKWIVRPQDGDSLADWLMDDLDDEVCSVDFEGGVVNFPDEKTRMYWADGYSIGEKRAEGLMTAFAIIEGFLKSETPEARIDRRKDLAVQLQGVPADVRQRVAEMVERIK